MKEINQLIKSFFSMTNLDTLTKEKTLELLNAFQDFVVKSDMIDQETLDLELINKHKRCKKKTFVSGPEYKHIYTRLVFPEDLNSHGTLFGGKILAWTDTSGALACNEEGYKSPVTVEMKDVYFLSSPSAGDVVKFFYQVLLTKKTYMWIRVIGVNIMKNNIPVIDSEMRCTNVEEKNKK